MAEPQRSVARELTLESILSYHEDVISSLKLYFSPASPNFEARFVGQSAQRVRQSLLARLEESEQRSSFAVLTSLEAAFRIDFESRCRKKLKDDLSRYFRSVAQQRNSAVRLDEDIFEGWKRHAMIDDRSSHSSIISELRSAFRYRHWLAHGRYWTPKWGRKYSFDSVFAMAEAVISGFPFES